MKNILLHTVAVIVSITLWVPSVAQAAIIFNDESGHDAFDDGNGISSWEWLGPNGSSIGTDESSDYHVGAWDADGISLVEIHVNGALAQTCTYGVTNENAECTASILANDFDENTDIFVNAKITDATESYTWTTGYTIHRTANEASPIDEDPTQSDDPNPAPDATTSDATYALNVWDWTDDDVTSIATNENVKYHAGAWAEKGLKRIIMHVDGVATYTCNYFPGTGNKECWTAINTQGRVAGSTVFVNALVIDNKNQESWTVGKTITIASGTGGPTTGETPEATETPVDNPVNQPYVVNVWDWTDDYVKTLSTDSTLAYHAGAWAEKGLKRITMYVDGVEGYSCTYWPGTGNKECWTEIDGRGRTAGSTVFVNALVRDNKGQEVWTKGVTIAVTQGAAAPSDPNPAPDATTSDATYALNVWDWTDDDVTSIATNENVKYHAGAWAEKGLKRIIMHVDGVATYTCNYFPGTGNKECWTAINTQGRVAGSTVFVNALVIDNKNQESWTVGKTITIASGTGGPTTGETPEATETPVDNPVNQPYVVNVWDWTDDHVKTLSTDRTITYHAGAWAETGLRKIIIYVQGEPEYACTYFPGTGNKECWGTIKGRDYTPGTSIYVNAKVRDSKGQEVWTKGVTIAVTQ